MQRGSLAIVIRKEGPAVWQFRWSEKALDGARVQRKRVIGTVELAARGPAKRDTKKGTKTCPFGSSMVCAKSEQSFWKEWRGRRDSNSRPLP